MNTEADRLYFLHTCGWDPAPGERVLSYFVRYTDGSSSEIPIRNGNEIGSWWGGPANNARIAVESSNAVRNPIWLFCFRWKNPHPEKPIRSLDMVSANGPGVPAIVAVTAETRNSKN
ncbi:MAG: hypothetical protein BWY31_04304 [Lentisphaerae bacterium ADurb.Bin242]|nr:MAG: hypothetical protein BWY31_04304 [Lentisphaerae bacterium ADurb.Bin242]